jgi:hypothetical protein
MLDLCNESCAVRPRVGLACHTASPILDSRTLTKALIPPSKIFISLYQELGPNSHFRLAVEARIPQQL